MAEHTTCFNFNDTQPGYIPSSLSINTTSNDNDSLLNKLDIKSYGTITFPRNYCNTAQFIRVPPDVSPMRVKDLFIVKNHNKRSSLVISIQGSAKESNLRSKLFRIFRESLLKVSKTTDIWIITAGLNTRVTKLFGEIVRTHPDPSGRIHLIGIVSWGCVSNVDQLDVQGANVTYSQSKSDEKGVLPLEPNHTHFIFIDDGTKYKHACALKFRGQFERVINERFSVPTTTNNNEENDKYIKLYPQSDSMPVVIVVIEGCADAIKKVHGSVVKDRIPVVFIEGTGGCCDLFAKCYHLYNGYKSKAELFDQTNKDSASLAQRNEKIKNKLRQTLKIVNYELAETSCTNAPDRDVDYFQLIYECVETRNICLNFLDFKVHSLTGNDVASAILQALLKITSNNNGSCEMILDAKCEQLNLAYEWKQIDIVTKSIIINERDWQRVELNDLFERALKENQANFVQLFLDHDFSLNNLFENNHKLLELYQRENCNFTDEFNGPLRSIYTETNQSLIGNFFQLNAIFDADDFPKNSFGTSSENNRRNRKSPNCSSSVISETDISTELFLWSILTGKQELALLFWSRGRNKICAAFIAILVCKNKARKDKNSRYQGWVAKWEQLAVEILEKFSETNPSECKQAIIRAVPEFDNVTWLQLAVMAESTLFIAKPIVQDVLVDVWCGHIDSHVSNSLIIFSTFMPWYGGFLPYSKESLEKNDKYSELDDSHPTPAQLQFAINKLIDGAGSSLMNSGLDKEANSDTEANDGSQIERRKTSGNQYIRKVSMFLYAPRVKYLYNLYFRVIFLMLFSYMILSDYYPLYEFQSGKCFSSKEEQNDSNLTKTNSTINKKSNLPSHRGPSTTELVLIVWMFTLFCEAIREIGATRIQSIHRKIEVYLAIFWNKLDALAFLLFFIACILRLLPVSECFCVARIVLAVDLSIWYIRTLDVFSAAKRLGPKLVMIGEMVHDLSFFMLIIIVFILAFGVSTYSLLHDVQKFSWHIPRHIINLAYWEIFGELDTVDDVKKNYDFNGYVMFFLLLAYTTIASVLLINLLIAMFSNTFDRLQLNTDSMWKFQRYSLVCHYLTRPLLPPPLIFITHIWRITSYVCSRIFKTKWFYIRHENRAKLKRRVNLKLTKQIEEIEDALGNEVYFFSFTNDRKPINCQNDSNAEQICSLQRIILTKIKTIKNQVQALQNQQSNLIHDFQCLTNGIQTIDTDDIEMSE